jgi:hypothetical protein
MKRGEEKRRQGSKQGKQGRCTRVFEDTYYREKAKEEKEEEEEGSSHAAQRGERKLCVYMI